MIASCVEKTNMPSASAAMPAILRVWGRADMGVPCDDRPRRRTAPDACGENDAYRAGSPIGPACVAHMLQKEGIRVRAADAEARRKRRRQIAPLQNGLRPGARRGAAI